MHQERSNIRHLVAPSERLVEVNKRLLVVMLGLLLVAGGLVFRLVQLQILEPERYVEQGLAQRTKVISLPGPRGDVLDRNGNRLATSIPQKTFFVDPAFVKDAGAAAEALAPVLGQDVASLYEKFSADSRFVYLARQVSDQTAHAVEALAIPGVYSLDEPTRFTPAGDGLAASILGRVGVDSRPLSGIEYAYDYVLAGVPGEMVVEKNPAGQTIPMGPRELEPAHPGSDLVLTIDRSLQFEVERLLLEQVDAMVAKGGVAVVTQTSTGDILAMASVTRDADLNVILSPKNLAATWAYEPGSVMKAITFASVLDAELAEPSTVRTVPWSFDLYDRQFTDIYRHEPTDWTVTDIVTQSSNVGSVMWATELGARRFDPYLRAFGLSEPVLGLPGETAGILAEVDDWDGTTIGAVALGQGISVSALQMIQAYNVIANDGVAVPLRLVQSTIDPEGNETPFNAGPVRYVISPETAGEMRSILRNVVAAGTGTAAAVEGYEVAGKTGTARKPLPTGGYQDAEGRYHYVSSFVGFLPANDPEISILVALDEPASSIYASTVAAPVFADIAHYALRHFGIPPSAALLAAAPTLAGEEEVVAEDGILAANPAPLVDRATVTTAESAEPLEPEPVTSADPTLSAEPAADPEPAAAEPTADPEPAAVDPVADPAGAAPIAVVVTESPPAAADEPVPDPDSSATAVGEGTNE